MFTESRGEVVASLTGVHKRTAVARNFIYHTSSLFGFDGVFGFGQLGFQL